MPARYAPIAFAFVLSAMMSFLVSGITTYRNAGFADGFFGLWFNAWWPAWLIAFPVVLVVGPLARRIVNGMIRADERPRR